MRKLFSLLVAVLFAGGLMAATEMTCAQAREAALNGSTEEVVVTGYVTAIQEAWQAQFKNVSFWMADEKDGGKVFEAFRVNCENEADAPAIGDKVKVTGTLTVYKETTPETAQGGSFVIIEKAGGETPPSAATDTISCEKAVELAVGGSTDEVIVKGYVTEIAAEWSSQYKNISFWMADSKDGGQVFQAYRVACQTEEEAPEVGDLVWVKGNLKQHYEISEINAGGTFGILNGDGGQVTPPVSGDDPANCAEAAEAALSVSKNNELYNGGKVYTIRGYVTEIAGKETDYEQYGNMSFWMADEADGGKVLEAYRCVPEGADKIPAVGDLVEVTGQLTKYNSTPEFAAGCTCKIIEKGEGGEQGGNLIELDVEYAEAYYIADMDLWQINLYKDYDPETETVTYPDLYIGVFAKSATAIAGTYSLDNEEIAFIEVDVATNKTVAAVEATDVVITHLGDGIYHYELEFLGDDDNTYVLDVTLKTIAYDDEDYIDLIEGIENIVLKQDSNKVMVDGVVYIIRDGKLFNTIGARVR